MTDPEVIEHFRKEGEVILEVTMKRYYILRLDRSQTLKDIVHDWFVKWRGSSHAWRDGCHVGGSADEVILVKDLTNKVEVPITWTPETPK